MQTVESSEIANKEKTIPTEWFESKERLTEEVIKYALPLIEGESDQNYVNGIIEYIKLEEFIK